MPGNKTSFALHDVKTMAEHRSAEGGKILTAINADFLIGRRLLAPWGPVVVEGTLVKDYVKPGAGITSYFGIKKDGTHQR